MSVKVGDVRQRDFQADVWETSYRVIRHVKGNSWEIEQLPPSEEVLDKVLDFWAAEEARGATTSPIWDKTWDECDKSKGEAPRIVGWVSYEEMLERDLQRLEEQTGRLMTIGFINWDKWAEMF